jgi:methionyl-tRNA synthetase
VHKAKEEAYFFNMQKYADRLMEYIDTHPDFIMPPSRKNEMVNNFIKPGLQDLCVSRSTFKWGIPVDFDDKHVVYVWLDALTNYITSLGYDADLPYDKQPEAFKKYWPAVHIIGKDILRFHTIYWPIFLMALDLPLPKQVFGHPWMLIGDGKMSKSKNNVIYAEELVEKFGVDAVRYYCLHEMPFAQDGTITWDLIVERINSDLANVLGNLVSRTIAMSNKYFDGIVSNPKADKEVDADLKQTAEHTVKAVQAKMDELQVGAALDEIFSLLRRTNKYIDETEPWVLARDESKKERLATVIYNLEESIRIAGVLLKSFMPETAEKILNAIGTEQRSFDSVQSFGNLEEGISNIKKMEPLFARIDPVEFAKSMNPDAKDEIKEEAKKQKKESKQQKKKEKKEAAAQPAGIEDFAKITLKAGKILSAEKHPEADRLLVEKVDLGNGDIRQIVSGIAAWYAPEDLAGKTVIVVSNLKPAKLRGVESQGMILCTDAGDKTEVVFLPDAVAPGTIIR